MPPPPIIATPGDPLANCYCTVAEADAYHETYVGGAAWLALADDAKTQALLQATRQLDAYVYWFGYASVPEVQALGWPRVGLVYVPTQMPVPATVVPDELKWATSEQARITALGGDRALEGGPGATGIKRLNAKGTEIEYFSPAEVSGGVGGTKSVITPSAWAYIAPWGELVQSGKGGAVALVRV